jgi:hypothetical protein
MLAEVAQLGKTRQASPCSTEWRINHHVAGSNVATARCRPLRCWRGSTARGRGEIRCPTWAGPGRTTASVIGMTSRSSVVTRVAATRPCSQGSHAPAGGTSRGEASMAAPSRRRQASWSRVTLNSVRDATAVTRPLTTVPLKHSRVATSGSPRASASDAKTNLGIRSDPSVARRASVWQPAGGRCSPSSALANTSASRVPFRSSEVELYTPPPRIPSSASDSAIWTPFV